MKEKLEPNEGNDEVRGVGHYIVPRLADVPGLEIDQKMREKGSRKYNLEIDERRYQSEKEKGEEQ